MTAPLSYLAAKLTGATGPDSIPSHFPPQPATVGLQTCQMAGNAPCAAFNGPSREAVKAEKQRNRAARYRNKPGQRAKEAARLRAWRASRKHVNLSATSTKTTS